MNSKLFFLFVASFLIMCYTGIGKSKLPDKMPEQTQIEYMQTNDEFPYYFKSIRIVKDTLVFIEKNNSQVISWSKKIKITDKENIYEIFRENKFDLVKNKFKSESKRIKIIHENNKVRDGIIYAVGDSIDVTVNVIIYDLISAKNKKKFIVVKNAIEDLFIKYENH